MRDYAKYGIKRKRSGAKNSARHRLFYVVLSVFVIGIAMSGIYAYRQSVLATHGIFAWLGQATSLLSGPEKQVKPEVVQKAKQAETTNETEIQFNFYTELPKMQVPIPQPSDDKKNPEISLPAPAVVKKEQVIPPASPPSSVAADSYVLQIAAFKNKTAAGELRVSLLLAGFEVEVVKNIVNNQQIYQLQQGPFSSVSDAKSTQNALKKKGFESVIKKIN